jgi:hypothetical protein
VYYLFENEDTIVRVKECEIGSGVKEKMGEKKWGVGGGGGGQFQFHLKTTCKKNTQDKCHMTHIGTHI